MTGLVASTGNLSYELVGVIVALSMIAGAADLLRQPGWAWRRAEENKAAYFVLVLLVPLIGLGMYLRTARPKVRTIGAAGRAASLVFESFGDDAVQAQRQDGWSVGTVITAPESFAGFGATTVADGQIHLVGAPTGPGHPSDSGGGFFSTGGGTLTATAPDTLTRTYQPTQRASIPVPTPEGVQSPVVPPGWKADPTGRHQFRYWAGGQWTENVADNGNQSRDVPTPS